MKRILVIGCGNPYRGDDGVGFRVADQYETLNEDHGTVQVMAVQELKPELVEAVSHADSVVFVHAATNGEPGMVWTREISSESHCNGLGTHSLRPAERQQVHLSPLPGCVSHLGDRGELRIQFASVAPGGSCSAEGLCAHPGDPQRSQRSRSVRDSAAKSSDRGLVRNTGGCPIFAQQRWGTALRADSLKMYPVAGTAENAIDPSAREPLRLRMTARGIHLHGNCFSCTFRCGHRGSPYPEMREACAPGSRRAFGANLGPTDG